MTENLLKETYLTSFISLLLNRHAQEAVPFALADLVDRCHLSRVTASFPWTLHHRCHSRLFCHHTHMVLNL